MDIDFQQHIPVAFPDSARVWVYQSSRLFTMSEALEIGDRIEQFLTDWQTHGTANIGFANLFFGQFLIIMADESNHQISGCSTDSSVRFVKEIEKMCNVNMFDRQTLAFIIKDKVQLLPFSQLNYAVENGFVAADTLYFNNLVANKKELLENWIQPISESWLAKRLNFKMA